MGLHRLTLAVLLIVALTAAGPGPSTHSGRVTSVTIYLVAVGGAGVGGPRIGCGDRLVPVTRNVSATAAPLKAALRQLLRIHQQYYGQSGLYNALYRSRLHLQRAVLHHGHATVGLTGTLSMGGECDDPRVGAQLRQTVLQFRAVRSATILINNVPLKKLLSGRG